MACYANGREPVTKKRRGDGFDWSEWKGTDTLRWTQIPDDWLDTLIPQLGEAEVRVVLWIGRQTYGWKKDWDQISLAQIVENTGLSMSAANKAAKSLEQKGIIEVKRTTAIDGGAEANRYRPIQMGGTASEEVGGTASEEVTRHSRTRDNNENEQPSVSSGSIPNDKAQLLTALATEFAPNEQPQAIVSYLGRFPNGLLDQAAVITRQSANAKNPIAYLYGVVQRLAEQESVKPLARQRGEVLPELSEAEYSASLEALERVKQGL